MTMAIYLGLDFGADSICVSKWNNEKEKVEIISDMDPSSYIGENDFPNIIYYKEDKGYIVGKSAQKRASNDAENAVFDIQEKFKNNNLNFNIPNKDEKYPVSKVVNDLFTHIDNRICEKYGGNDIDGMVIGIPSSYGIVEKNKLWNIAEKLDFKIIDFIEEPIAAFLSYNNLYSKGEISNENIAIINFGKRNTNIDTISYSKLENGNIEIETLTSNEIPKFGEETIDKIIRQELIKKLDIDLYEITDKNHLRIFMDELIKKSSETREEYLYNEEEIIEIDDIINGINVSVEISKVEFKSWILDNNIYQKVNKIINLILKNNEKKYKIDKILFVGNIGKLDFIQNKIISGLDNNPKVYDSSDINQIIGYGTGVYCSMITSNKENINIKHNLNYDIGFNINCKIETILSSNCKYGVFSMPVKYKIKNYDKNKYIGIYVKNKSIKDPIGFISIPKNTENVEISLGTDKRGILMYKLYKDSECIEYAPIIEKEYIDIKDVIGLSGIIETEVNGMAEYRNVQNDEFGMKDKDISIEKKETVKEIREKYTGLKEKITEEKITEEKPIEEEPIEKEPTGIEIYINKKPVIIEESDSEYDREKLKKVITAAIVVIFLLAILSSILSGTGGQY